MGKSASVTKWESSSEVCNIAFAISGGQLLLDVPWNLVKRIWNIAKRIGYTLCNVHTPI